MSLLRLLVPLVLALVANPAYAQERPRNLILFIGDGFGPAYAELARGVSGAPLAMDAILVGAAQTASANSRVVESAAAATAFACGVAVRNGSVSVTTDGRPCRTLLEAARAAGAATGIVTNTRVTHATPAAFVAHVQDRDLEEEIASQVVAARLDVLFGGGAAFFRPASFGGRREDERDLLQEMSASGATVVTDPTCFSTIDATPAVALLADDHLAYEIDREETTEPSLAQMTDKALEILGAGRRPFVLMIEGGRIDHAGHGNDPAAAAREVVAYDAAIALALEWARSDGRTLVVGVSDHETGGLSLGRDGVYDWHAQALAAANQSAGRMADRIRVGEDPAAVLRAGAGLDSLSTDERTAVIAARDDAYAMIASIVSTRAGVAWTTAGHTAVDVGVYAYGPGAGTFAGSRTSAAVGQLLFEALGLTGR